MLVCFTVLVTQWLVGLRGILGDPALSARAASGLVQQIRERQQEIAPFYKVQQAQETSPNAEATTLEALGSELGCSDLSGLAVVDLLGAGYTKMVLKVVLVQGLQVALKTVNSQGADMRSCLEEFRDPQGCQDLVSFKLRKEIILLQRLQHPNIVQVIIYKLGSPAGQSGRAGQGLSAVRDKSWLVLMGHRDLLSVE